MSNNKINFFLTLFALIFINVTIMKESENNTEGSKQESPDINENIFEEISGFRMRSPKELEYISEITDITILKFVYLKSSPRSRKVAKYIKNITERLPKIFGVAMIDCELFPKNYKDCAKNDYLADSFPKLKLLIPPNIKFNKDKPKLEDYSEYPWTEKEMTEESIYNYIQVNLPFQGIKLKENNFQHFLNSDYFNKAILFTQEKDSQLIWKGLSNYFFDRLLFAEVHKNVKPIIDYFKITKFPSLVIYQVNDHSRLIDEPQIIKYEGNFETEKLIDWMTPYATQEKRYMRLLRGLGDPSAAELARDIQLSKIDKQSYEDYLNKRSDKNILLYFGKNSKNVKQIVKEYMISTQGFFVSAFYDCSSDTQFCRDNFNVTKFPVLKLIHKYDNKTITTLEERLQTIKSLDISDTCNKTLHKQILENFPTNVVHVKALGFPYSISESRMKNKFIIVHLYKSSEQNSTKFLLPFDLISLDEKIGKLFDFYEVENVMKETISMNKFPSDSGIFFMYLGGNDHYKIIPVAKSAFYSTLQSIASNIIYQVLNAHIRPEFNSNQIYQIETSTQFRKNCLDQQYCILTFMDLTRSKENIEKFGKQIMILENVKVNSKFEKIPFNFVNATCHDYLANEFGVKISELPTIVTLYPYRSAYSIFNGYWDNFPVKSYLERAISNRVDNINISLDKLQFKNLDCDGLYSESNTKPNDTNPEVNKVEEVVNHTNTDNLNDSSEQNNKDHLTTASNEKRDVKSDL